MAYMLAAVGRHPNHDGARGPVEPDASTRHRKGGKFAAGASYTVLHDAGNVMLLEVHGPARWLNSYILKLPGALAAREWGEFVTNLRAAAADAAHPSHTLATDLMASLPVQDWDRAAQKRHPPTASFTQEAPS